MPRRLPPGKAYAKPKATCRLACPAASVTAVAGCVAWLLWPLSLAFFPPVWLLLGWCELRADFRSFRLDRIAAIKHLDERYRPTPGRRLTDYLRRVGYQAA